MNPICEWNTIVLRSCVLSNSRLFPIRTGHCLSVSLCPSLTLCLSASLFHCLSVSLLQLEPGHSHPICSSLSDVPTRSFPSERTNSNCSTDLRPLTHYTLFTTVWLLIQRTDLLTGLILKTPCLVEGMRTSSSIFFSHVFHCDPNNILSPRSFFRIADAHTGRGFCPATSLSEFTGGETG